MNKETEVIELVSKYKKIVLTFDQKLRHKGSTIKPVYFKNHFATVDKGIFEKVIVNLSNYKRDFAIVGEHPKDWVPDHLSFMRLRAECIRIGAPTEGDINDLKATIVRFEALVEAFGITQEEVEKSGKKPYEYVDNYVKEAQTIREQSPNALELLIEEAKSLGLKIPAKPNEVKLTDMIVKEKDRLALEDEKKGK